MRTAYKTPSACCKPTSGKPTAASPGNLSMRKPPARFGLSPVRRLSGAACPISGMYKKGFPGRGPCSAPSAAWPWKLSSGAAHAFSVPPCSPRGSLPRPFFSKEGLSRYVFPVCFGQAARPRDLSPRPRLPLAAVLHRPRALPCKDGRTCLLPLAARLALQATGRGAVHPLYPARRQRHAHAHPRGAL